MSAIFITGVSSFIGGHLADALSKRGHVVSGSVSSPKGQTRARTASAPIVLRLGDDLDPAVANGIDSVVHCAWDLRSGSRTANVDGTITIAEAFAHTGAHQVFIGSYSGHSGAVTEYGIGKHQVQQFMAAHGHAVARLGVTIGAGGIYKRMRDALTQHFVVPLIDGGRDLVPILAIDDLTSALVQIIERRLRGSFNLFNPELVTMRELLVAIRATVERPARLIPIPSALLMAPLAIAKRIGVRLPLDEDNIRALRANRSLRERADLGAFVPNHMTLREMVEAAARR